MQISALYLGDDLQAFLPMTASNGMESFQSLQSKGLRIHLHQHLQLKRSKISVLTSDSFFKGVDGP